MLDNLLTLNYPVTSKSDCICNCLLLGIIICSINMSEHLLLSLVQQINSVFPQPQGIIKFEKKGGSYRTTLKLIHYGRSTQQVAMAYFGAWCLPGCLVNRFLGQGNSDSAIIFWLMQVSTWTSKWATDKL